MTILFKFIKNHPSIILIGIFFFILSCNTLNPTAPSIEKSDETISPVLSSIQLPILFPISDLEKLINNKLPDTLHHDQSFTNNGNDGVKLLVKKVGTVRIQMINNELRYTVPLGIWADVKTKLGIQSHTDFALELSFKSTIDLSNKWILNTNTTYHQMRWLKKPSIKIAFIKVNIAKMVERLITEKIPTILPKLDDALSELPLKNEVSNIWNDLQKPIRINKQVQNCWLSIEPKKIHLRSLFAANNHLTFDIVVEAFIELYPSNQPNEYHQVGLPDLGKRKNLQQGFKIAALIRLPFSELNSLLKQKLENQQVKIDEYEIKLKKASLHGGKNRVVLETKIKGDVKGKLYFKGIPLYDSLTHELTIDQFDFDISTENVLIESADWLLHDGFKDEIVKTLRLPIQPYLQQLPSLIQKGISNSKLGKTISLNLSNFELQPDTIIVNNEAILLLINVSGNLILKIDGLKNSI